MTGNATASTLACSEPTDAVTAMPVQPTVLRWSDYSWPTPRLARMDWDTPLPSRGERQSPWRVRVAIGITFISVALLDWLSDQMLDWMLQGAWRHVDGLLHLAPLFTTR